jgi:hypothetical protein
MKFNPSPWLAILAIVGISVWLRFNWIEQTELGFFCDGGGQTTLCKARWLVVQTFNRYGLGYFSLALGLLATLTRSGLAGFLAGATGAMGLILYTWDWSAAGFLLGTLALARAQLSEYRHEHGTGQ